MTNSPAPIAVGQKVKIDYAHPRCGYNPGQAPDIAAGTVARENAHARGKVPGGLWYVALDGAAREVCIAGAALTPEEAA